jgi:ferredoxin-NADP reductase
LVDREYTPLSSWEDLSRTRILRLLIKVYPDGTVTQYLAKLKLGDVVRVSAPTETLDVPSFLPTGKNTTPPNQLVLIAGGTGIMPMLQILREALHDASPICSCVLVYSNKSPQDLLCWQQIHELQATRSKAKAFKVVVAFTSSAAQVEDVIFESGLPLAQVVRKRVDSTVLGEVLRPFSQEKHAHLHVIVSGPTGLFQTMRGALHMDFQGECTWVNLDG